MTDVSGKRLLVLGAGGVTVGSEESLVRIAQQMGAYVIVTDNRHDWSQAPAKPIADEAWDISWSDVDALAKLCRERRVDGVLAGFSEHKVLCAARLCDVLGLPFYAAGADLETLFDKARFLAACEEVGVPVPRRYCLGAHIDYPVVVKPVDAEGSRGVFVCLNEGEMSDALRAAREASRSGELEIEEYVAADEAFFYYLVVDGRASLVASCDLCALEGGEGSLRVPVATRYPSVHERAFLKNDDAVYQRLISSLGIRDGLIGFQCFVREGRALVHDPTYRLDGSALANVMFHDAGTNAARLLIHHSLTGRLGPTDELGRLLDRARRSFQLYLGIELREGVVARLCGPSDASEVEGALFLRRMVEVGDRVDLAAPVFKRTAYSVGLCASGEEELERRVARLYDSVRVVGEAGEDLTVRIDPHALVTRCTYGEKDVLG
ncbi:MAG TPA: hypothetical protein IAA15_00170 [Candidatus Olsenella pullicola]|nr:hypothetical protein [Candidatus Olsenella pullicola]